MKKPDSMLEFSQSSSQACNAYWFYDEEKTNELCPVQMIED